MLILTKRHWTRADMLKAAEDPGRKKGKPAGSYIDDLAQLQKAIVLCDSCVRKFDWKRAHYYRQRECPYVQGNCDDCRAYSQRASLFIHGATVKDCWVTREDAAKTRRNASIVS